MDVVGTFQMRFRLLAFVLFTSLLLLFSGCAWYETEKKDGNEIRNDGDGIDDSDDPCSVTCDTVADCIPCIRSLGFIGPNDDATYGPCWYSECDPSDRTCSVLSNGCSLDEDCQVNAYCDTDRCLCVPYPDCGEPDGDSCPLGCQAVSGYEYTYECGCTWNTSTIFCKPVDTPCNGPSQLVQNPHGHCRVLDQGCGDKLPPGWIPGCCDLPSTPAPELHPWGCEGCMSHDDCSGGPGLICGPCYGCVPSGCNVAPSQELSISCGGEACQAGPCGDDDPWRDTGKVCALPWWAMGLEEGDEELSYTVDGHTYTTWDEIVEAFGWCSNVYYWVFPYALNAEGYATEAPPYRDCRYPIDCGTEGCGLMTTFCCTDQSAGGSTSCKTYDEILPARNGVTVDLDQRTCTLP